MIGTGRDPMRSLSVVVRMTPRQAVSAMRALEIVAATTEDKRAYRARERVMFGLWDAGWQWEDEDESWRLVGHRVKDPS